jgi:Recombination endonuclease VII
MPLKDPWRALWYNYKLTQTEYESLLEAQAHRCAICGKHESECKRKGRNNRNYQIILHVDHDHVTGTIRGLLCHKCNTLIGYAGDDRKILQNAISYLEKSAR